MTVASFEQPPQKKGPSLVVQIGVLVLLSLLALGGGWFAGFYLKRSTLPPEEPGRLVETLDEVDAVTVAIPPPPEAGEPEGEPLRQILIPLEAVTTNLAAPSEMWVRLELSFVFSERPSPELVRAIHQDILAYMRTVTLHQVQGASGFQHLKADITERARLRSDGLATELVIRTLLFE